MIDLQHLEQYRENNRIEAKRALGGLPHSIWETYSSFANTLGGIILLGVVEHKDKTLHTVNLPDPEELVSEFWEIVRNPRLTSVNILSANDVRIEEVNGDRIIVITVPRAERFYKPVYVDGNPVNTYRRSGEGDYRCTQEEYQAMVRDAAYATQDMQRLEQYDVSVFDFSSVKRYRERVRKSHPNHVWEALDDEEFLFKIGAVSIGEQGGRHPTAGGLLMFGTSRRIREVYPAYLLDYREEERQLVSSSGDRGGNVFDFYEAVYERITTALPNRRLRMAAREALANCLVNADYYGEGGVVIIKRADRIVLSNPGDFRIEVAAAKSGGFSDPRNGLLMKMFNLIDIGDGAGSGIPNIFYTWKRHGWSEPTIKQTVHPNRIEFLLPLMKRGDKVTRIKQEGRQAEMKSALKRAMLIDYLTDHAEGSFESLNKLLGVKPSNLRKLLDDLTAEGIVEATENGTYRLRY